MFSAIIVRALSALVTVRFADSPFSSFTDIVFVSLLAITVLFTANSFTWYSFAVILSNFFTVTVIESANLMYPFDSGASVIVYVSTKFTSSAVTVLETTSFAVAVPSVITGVVILLAKFAPVPSTPSVSNLIPEM